MALPTVNDMATEVMREVGEDTSDADLVLIYEGWVQDVYDIIGTSLKWHFQSVSETLNLVASTKEYSLAADTDIVRGMRHNPTDDPIYFIELRELVSRGVDFENESKPQYFYYGEFDEANNQWKVNFWPIPDQAYNVDVYTLSSPKDLATGDTIPFPRAFINVMKNGIRWYAYTNEEKLDVAVMYRDAFSAGLEVVMQRYKFPEERRRLVESDVVETDYMRDVRLPPDHFHNVY